MTLPAALTLGACSDDANLTDLPDRPPVLTVMQVMTDEDVPVEINVLAGATDPDGDSLTVMKASAVGHRVEILPGGILRVTPSRDFNGMFTVSYDVTDGTLASTSHVSVTVRSVNDVPVATDATLSVQRAGTTIALTGSDADRDTLTYEIEQAPSHGTLDGDPPILRYVPDASFVGEDMLVYRVSDGKAPSAPATIRLEVGRGSAPNARPGSSPGLEDQPFSVNLIADDPDGDPLTYTVVTQPKHGTLSGTPPFLLYTPAPDFNGDDSVEFTVSDGIFSSAAATVAIHVAPVNDTPVATPQSVAATEDTPVAITLAGSDVDGNTLTFQLVSSPSNGTLSFVGGTLTYTPAANYHGPDSFTFAAFDGLLRSPAATVTIDVASVEDPPVAASFSRPLNEDSSLAFTLLGSDGDGDPISYTVTSTPQHGSLSGTAPSLTYTPDANFNGQDSFTYTVSSKGVTSPPGTVTLQVTPVNDAPVAVGGAVTTDEDTPVAITLQASDVDGQPLTFTIVTPPADGSLTGGPGASWTYTPAHNANGSRSFVFRASDGSLSSTATVTITINPVNDAPTTVDDFVMTDLATPITFDVAANDFDVDGEAVTLDSAAAPAHGSAEIVDGKLLYTPDAGFNGTDVFVYTVVDAHGASSTGNAHVGVGTFPPGAPAETIATMGSSIAIAQPELAPAISGNGRFIAFTTNLALVGDDTNARTDVYLFDRRNHAFTRVSVSSAGDQGNGTSQRPQLSADGRYIVFESFATNLVAGDTNGQMDVFRHDRVTGETVRVSVATGDGQGTGFSRDAKISDDGNLIAFTSTAFDLVANDANGVSDVFLRDVTAGTTTRISVSFTGSDADLASAEPALSGDGRFVAFSSAATNLAAGDSNNVSDVFVRDRVAGTTTRVSVSTTGGEANGPCAGPSISGDGRIISFLSTATNLVMGAPVPAQLYTRDVAAQITQRPVNSTSSVIWGRLSGDGHFVTEFGSSGVTIRNRIAGTGVVLSSNLVLFWPVLSSNGQYLILLDTSSIGSVTVTVRPNPA